MTMFQYAISPDASAGNRTISGLWQGSFIPFVDTVPARSIVVGQYLNAEPDILIAAPITDVPATLTIIPAPATLALFASDAMISIRRRP